MFKRLLFLGLSLQCLNSQIVDTNQCGCDCAKCYQNHDEVGKAAAKYKAESNNGNEDRISLRSSVDGSIYKELNKYRKKKLPSTERRLIKETEMEEQKHEGNEDSQKEEESDENETEEYSNEKGILSPIENEITNNGPITKNQTLQETSDSVGKSAAKYKTESPLDEQFSFNQSEHNKNLPSNNSNKFTPWAEMQKKKKNSIQQDIKNSLNESHADIQNNTSKVGVQHINSTNVTQYDPALLEKIAKEIVEAVTNEEKSLDNKNVTHERLRKARIQYAVMETTKKLKKEIEQVGHGDPVMFAGKIKEHVLMLPRKSGDENGLSVRGGHSRGLELAPIATDYMKLIMARNLSSL